MSVPDEWSLSGNRLRAGRRSAATAVTYSTDGQTVLYTYELYRIEQAVRLLNEQQLSVSEVAYNLGFADTHHFSRTFKRVMGLSPGKYRSGS